MLSYLIILKLFFLNLKKPEITSESILENLKRDVGAQKISENYNFYELKAAENKVEEYALVSNII